MALAEQDNDHDEIVTYFSDNRRPVLSAQVACSYPPWAILSLPAAASSRWCVVSVRVAGQMPGLLALISFHSVTGEACGAPVFLHGAHTSRGTRFRVLVHVPDDAVDLVLQTVGRHRPEGTPVISVTTLHVVQAALSLLVAMPSRLGSLAAQVLRGRFGDARRELARVALHYAAANQPRDYASWIELCEPPPSRGSGTAGLVALVFGDPESLVSRRPPQACGPRKLTGASRRMGPGALRATACPPAHATRWCCRPARWSRRRGWQAPWLSWCDLAPRR